MAWVTDRVSNFMNKTTTSLYVKLDINLIFTTLFHPTSIVKIKMNHESMNAVLV